MTDFFEAGDFGYNMTVLPDNKILVAGMATNGTNVDFALIRYNTDGSLDTSFGTGGKVMTDFFGNQDIGNGGLTVLPDGKILVAGHATNGTDRDFALVRYLPISDYFSFRVGALGTSSEYPIDLTFGVDQSKVRVQATWTNNENSRLRRLIPPPARGEDIYDYAKDIANNSFNAYRMFVKLYGKEGKARIERHHQMLIDMAEEAIAYASPDIQAQFQKMEMAYWQISPVPRIPEPILEKRDE